MWGIGNVNYGLTMRYLGMSLGIGVAIGVTLVGTLVPPLMHGQFLRLFTSKGGLYTLAGILTALLGIAIDSYAGHRKEKCSGLARRRIQPDERPRPSPSSAASSPPACPSPSTLPGPWLLPPSLPE